MPNHITRGLPNIYQELKEYSMEAYNPDTASDVESKCSDTIIQIAFIEI